MRDLTMRGCVFALCAAVTLIMPAQISGQSPTTIRMVYWPGPESDAMRKVVDWYDANRTPADGTTVEMVLFSREGFFDKEAAVLAARSSEVDMVFTASYILGRHAAAYGLFAKGGGRLRRGKPADLPSVRQRLAELPGKAVRDSHGREQPFSLLSF